MPVTIGSVGDIIAICILVKDCVNALSEAKGAAKAYQAVIRELYILEKALLEVDLLARTHATTAELGALFDSAKTTVDGCRKSLQDFQAKIQKYGAHLTDDPGLSVSKKTIAGSAMKLLWQVSMKDHIATFRAEVVAYSLSLNQLLSAATMHVMKANHEAVVSQIQASQQHTSASLKSQDTVLDELRQRLQDVDRRLSANNSIALQIAQHARLDWLKQLGQDLKGLMGKIVMVNLATYNAVVSIQKSLPPPTQQFAALAAEPMFYLEDAVGRVSPITLQFITCWEAFHAVIEVRFRGMQGHQKILNKEYSLQNRATGKDIDTTQKWERVFLPGQWVDMSVIFRNHDKDDSDTCPKCHANANQPPGLEVKCSVCKLVYQRITELSADDAATTEARPERVFAPEAPYSASGPRPTIRPTPPSLSQPGKRKREDHPDEDITNFTRVRVIAKKRRLNPKLSASATPTVKRKWEDEMEIDTFESPKRAKSQLNEEEEEAATKLTKNGEQHKGDQNSGDANEWTKSNFELDFNKCTGNETPQQYNFFKFQSQSTLNPPEGETSAKCTSEPSTAATKQPRKKSHRPPRATEEDATRLGIPAGYSLKNWDPTEEPIILMGSVFDGNSLGKWIYDWSVYLRGPSSPTAETAGELWLLLIQLAGKIKRAEASLHKISRKEDVEMTQDFLESGDRLWMRFYKVLKESEDSMWKASKSESRQKEKTENMQSPLGKHVVTAFIDTMFGHDQKLEKTQNIMVGMDVWIKRFDANCEGVLREHPS